MAINSSLTFIVPATANVLLRIHEIDDLRQANLLLYRKNITGKYNQVGTKSPCSYNRRKYF